MNDKQTPPWLNDLFTRLNRSINIDYLVLIDEKGMRRAHAGSPGPIIQGDVDGLLRDQTCLTERMSKTEGSKEIHIIKKGTVECYVAAVDESVRLLAMTSIEHPSVLIRNMLNEIMAVCEEIKVISQTEWKTSERATENMTEDGGTCTVEGIEAADSLESIFKDHKEGVKIKEASKYWEGASSDPQTTEQAGQTISFDEARRSGLVPDEQK